MRWSLQLVDDEAPPRYNTTSHAAAKDDAPPAPKDEDDDEKPDDEDDDDEAKASGDGFHAVIIPEGKWSGDNRYIETGALDTRDLPLPLMGLIKTTAEHEEAVAVGHFTRMEKDGAGLWHGYGDWAASAEAAQVRAAIRAGDVTGVSGDLDDVEFEILFDVGDEDSEDEGLLILASEEGRDERTPEQLLEDGDYIAMEVPDDRMRVTRARIMGATVVPFPAFQECFIEDLRPDEPLGGDPSLVAAVTAIKPPVRPPRGWFDPPKGHHSAYEMDVDDNGRIHGYPAASWNDCHISYPDQCVTPPRSASNYAYFKVGHVTCDDGSKVRTGPLCLRGGHADRRLSAQEAMAHYDDTDSAFADVAIGEDRYGMWVAGALRPHVTPEAVRIAMASGFSIDARPIGGNLEVIALSCVNTPGFRNRALIFEHDGLVASMIVHLPPPKDYSYEDSAIERIAASIGLSTEQRLAKLDERVLAAVS